MAIHPDALSDERIEARGGQTFLRARCDDADLRVQCYVSGRLRAVERPAGGCVRFILGPLGENDSVALLAVDAAGAATDRFAEAFAGVAAANRVRVELPRRLAHRPGDRLRVRLGEPGGPGAPIAFEAAVHPRMRRGGGFGMGLTGGFGFDGTDAPGLGERFGDGEFGFDPGALAWTSDPLPPGDRPARVSIVDAAGRETLLSETVLTLGGPPRAAKGLTCDAYDPEADRLELSWTPSADLPA